MSRENGVRIVPLPIHDDDDETIWYRLTVLVELSPGADLEAIRLEAAAALMEMPEVHACMANIQEMGA